MIQKNIFIIMIISTLSCTEKTAFEDETISKERVRIETGKDVEIIYSDSAHIKARVTAPDLLYFTDKNNPKQEFTHGVKAFFYDLAEQQQSVLVGKYAIRAEQKGITIIRDSVIWESTVEGRLETSELVWDERTNIISTEKPVTIRQKGQIIHGIGFKTDEKLQRWRINVPTGQMKIDDITKSLQ
jgi:LPS export ABC transporter protein LptC